MKKNSILDRIKKEETSPFHADVPKVLLDKAKIELKKRNLTQVDLATVMLADFIQECEREKK